ncbi:MAG: Tfp pilus assembly protein FimT/FimU [Alphaproteobacteria bacterium]
MSSRSEAMNPTIRICPRRAGFSLLEVLAVLTIMALVLGAVAFRAGGGLERVRLDALARHVSDELNRTRIEAIRTNRERVFRVDMEARRYGAGRAGHKLPEGVGIRLVTARTETSVDAASGAIRFFPDGTSTGGRVELERQGRVRVVRVDWLTGHVRVEEGRADG